MLIGLIQFKLSQKMFGEIGLSPKVIEEDKETKEEAKPLTKKEKQRLVVVGILAFFSIFFWAAFEQAGSSMNIFASEYTDRSLVNETSISIYKIVSALLSALPVGILTWLFWGMNKSIGKEYPTAMSFMALSVLILWGIIGYMVYNQFSQTNPEVPATWFQSLNALFIFTLAPVFCYLAKACQNKIKPKWTSKICYRTYTFRCRLYSNGHWSITDWQRYVCGKSKYDIPCFGLSATYYG